MGRNDHLFSHNDGFIHLCYVLRNISRNQVMISVTRHCCFSSWSTEHRNPSAVLSNDVGWKADVSAGDKFSKTRQLDGWVARPQTRKIMYFSFFLDPPPPHTHTHFNCISWNQFMNQLSATSLFGFVLWLWEYDLRFFPSLPECSSYFTWMLLSLCANSCCRLSYLEASCGSYL